MQTQNLTLKESGPRMPAKCRDLPSRATARRAHDRAGVLNAFTVDVEDYYHVEAFADRIGLADWDSYPSRVAANTRRVLALLEQYQVRATFFVLGWVAYRFPHLVREIQAAGHDIGCHSFAHRLIYRLTPSQFRSDLRRATTILEDLTGRPVTAFRAPSFSITPDSLWALEILIEEGYRYDSSIFPIYHDKYGIPGSPRFPYTIRFGTEEELSVEGPESRARAGRGASLCDVVPWEASCRLALDPGLSTPDACDCLREFPPAVARLFGHNLPVAGGGYFRLYPARLTLRLLAQINRRDRRPFMFYLHPWELDPDQPRLPCSLRSRFRHYQNLDSTERKLHRLLSTFCFGPLSQSLQQAANANVEAHKTSLPN